MGLYSGVTYLATFVGTIVLGVATANMGFPRSAAAIGLLVALVASPLAAATREVAKASSTQPS